MKADQRTEAKPLPLEEESLEGLPRFVKSWRQLYVALLLWLVLLIVLFYWFSEVWS
jgi:hypothetical protein